MAHLSPWHIHPQVERAGHLRRLDADLFQAFMQVVRAGTMVLLDPQALHGLPSCAVKHIMKDPTEWWLAKGDLVSEDVAGGHQGVMDAARVLHNCEDGSPLVCE